MLINKPPVDNLSAMALFQTLAGTLVTVVTMVYAFEFGSSRGSKQKDAVLGE